LPVGIPSVPYKTTTLTPGGGSGSGYTVTVANLPPGLTYSSGAISGTPTPASASNSPYAVAVTVTDSTPATHVFTLSLPVAPPLSISGPATLPAGTVSVSYAQTQVNAAGGTPPYTFTATGLPPGLSISTSGVITGTPTAIAGSPYAVTVKVTDANTTTATMAYSIAVGALPLQIVTGLLPAGVINAPYPFTSIQAQGGVGNYTYSITGLPPGLTTDGNGNIMGTPTSTTGSPFSVVVKVTDATTNSVSRTFSLSISGLLTVVMPTTLPAATLNTAYAPVTAIPGGGLPPYTWAATGLPAGMSIAIATGIISGTPTSAAGSPYSVTVTVTDSTGKTASMNYSLVVNAPLTISGPASLPSGTVGVAYTTTVTASGGSGVYTWSATGLPSGLSIASSTGAITGTPGAGTAGTTNVVVTVTDSNSATATKTYSLTTNPGPSVVPVLTGVSAAAEAQNLVAPNTWVTIYGSNFTAAGFTDNWTHSIESSSSGSLPISLDGVSVMVGGQPAFVAYISTTQINVLTANIGFGPLQVTVQTSGGTSNAVMITSQQDVPGFFEWPNASGNSPGDSSQQPVATHQDYSDAAANGTFPGTTTVPAKPGEIIILWGSGFGPTTPANPFGVAIPSTPTFNTSSNVSVTLNGAPVTVYQNQAFLTPGNAGLFQLGITIPSGLANGAYPLVVSINSVSSPTLTLTVHN
jgi:large repetitive protein